jgi:superfamily II DNA or RNA helicase
MATTSVLQKNITALAGRDHWLEGQKLFQEGAVLDVKLTGNSIESRVVDGIAKFERVRMTYSDHHVACKCSCTRGRTFCPHAVSALLELDQQQPGVLPFLYNPDYEPTLTSWASIASKMADEQAEKGVEKKAPEPETGVRKVASLKKMLEHIPSGRFEIAVEGEMLPTLESRWEQVTLTVQIHYQGKDYSGSNLKRLVEGSGAAGKMTMADFSPREQQIARYLVYNTNADNHGFVVGAYELSDIMHCMAGYDGLLCKGVKHRVNVEPLRAMLAVTERPGGDFSVFPRILLPNRGVLNNEDTRFIAGRSGYWIGQGCDYWWLPGYLNHGWVRMFLQGAGVILGSEEMERLKQLVGNGDFPVDLQYGDDPAQIQSKNIAVKPTLTLDWDDDGIQGLLEFDYKGVRVGKLAPPIIPIPGEGFVCRNEEAENNAFKQLFEGGFAEQEKHHALLLDKPLDMLKFIGRMLPRLEKDGWRVFFSRRFRRKVHASGRVVLELKPGPESDEWFDIGYRLVINRRVVVPWADVVKAIEEKRPAFMLAGGAGVAYVDKGLARVIGILNSRVKEIDDNILRFSRYAAIPIGEIVEKYWKGAVTMWQKLRLQLANPPKVSLELPPGLSFVPRDYQIEGSVWINMLAECGFHGILADEMGLGKTVQALMVLAGRRNRSGRPSLVVCPTSLVGNWQMEAAKFFPHMRTLAVKMTMKDQLAVSALDCDLVITSYALVRRDIDAYRDVQWDYLILDEAQHIKNHRTANAVSCKAILASHRLVLTGTPLENNLTEIWSLFDFLLPGFLGNAKGFHHSYVLTDDAGDAARRLAQQIRPFIMRRTKAEVCSQLPPKIEQIVYCDMEEAQRKLYERIRREAIEMLVKAQEAGWKQGRMELLSMLLRLRQVCCHPELLPAEMQTPGRAIPPSAKMELAKDVILEALDDDHRILIFSQFTSVLAIIRRWLDEAGIPYEYLDGSTKDRMERVERFNKTPTIPVFLLSLKAGGTGLNLTGADTVIHYDQWWNPMVENQATDRSHRIGQEKPVTSIKLIIRETIEERVLALQESKRELFQQLLAGTAASISEFSAEDVGYLLGSEK